jgi:hypothetical protein
MSEKSFFDQIQEHMVGMQAAATALGVPDPRDAEIERLRKALREIVNTENNVARSSIREYAAAVLAANK